MRLKLRLLFIAFGILVSSAFSKELSKAACPTIAMSGSSVSCYGISNGTAAVAISNGSGNYTITWSNGMNVPNLAGLAVGTYTVNVKDNNSGCTVIGAYVVGSPDPIAVTQIITNVNCFGTNTGAVNVTVVGGTAPYTYVWTNGIGSNVSTAQDLLNVVADNYTLNIVDSKGCTFSQTYTVTQPAQSLNGAGIVTNAKCFASATGAINIDVWGGTPAYTYVWTSGQGTQDVSALTAGSYSVTVTDFKGCSITLPFNITQPAVLGGGMSTSDVLCNGDPTGSVSISTTGGTAPYFYTWQNSTTLFATSSAVLNNIIADTYQVTVLDANGCTFVNSAVVNQPAVLTGSATAVNVSCFGGNDGSVDLTISGGSVPYAYQWTNSVGAIVALSQDLTNVPAEIYTAQVTDFNGCVLSVTQQVTQPALPISVAENATHILCNGNNTGEIDLTVIGGTSPFSYTWTSGQATEDIVNLLVGVYGYTVVDANGCSVVNSVTITEPPLLVISNTINDVNCFGESNGVIDLTVVGGIAPYSYSWTNSTYALSVTTQDLNGYAADSYTYTAVDANGCTEINTLVINEPPLLVSDIIGVNILCKGGDNGSVDLIVNGGVLPYTYLWNNGPITEDQNTLIAGYYEVLITDAQNCLLVDYITLTEPIDSLEYSFLVEDVLCNDGTDGSIDLFITGGTIPYAYGWSNGDTLSEISDLTSGSYEFTITDNNGCLLIDSIFVDQPAPLILNELITPVTCFGFTDGIVDITPSGGTMPYAYTWYNSNFALSTQTQDLVNYPADIYQLEVIDSNNCFYEMYLEIIQPDLLVVDYTYNVVSCKGGTNGNILVDIIGGNPGYITNWSNGSSTEDLLNIPSNIYTLIVLDQKNCTDTIDVDIAEPDSVQMTFEIEEVTCIDQLDGIAYAYPNGGNGGYFYNWSNGENSSINTGLSNQWYYLLVTDVLGCTGQDSVFITKNSIGCVEPVNAFTPNGDDYNDTWVIDNMNLYPEAEMQVFNKWGNLIHQQKGIYEAWKGTVNDQIAPSDTYYYIINLNAPDREPLKGNITILR